MDSCLTPRAVIADLYEARVAGIDAPKDALRRLLFDLPGSVARGSRPALVTFRQHESLDDLEGPHSRGQDIRITITHAPPRLGRLGWLPLTVGVFNREQSILSLCGRTGDAAATR